MHKIDKELAKLSPKEQDSIFPVLLQLQTGNFSNLDIIKLKGTANVFRVRKGSIRIIFTSDKSGIHLLSIGRRNEKTYQDF